MEYLRMMTVAAALFSMSYVVEASEVDELRARAERLEQSAAELAERGQAEEAEPLRRQAMAMFAQIERMSRHRPEQREEQMNQTRRRLEQLRQEMRVIEANGGNEDRLHDVRQETRRVEARLRELTQERPHRRESPHEQTAHRLDQMRIAIEHLQRAGLPEIAEQVVRRAEQLQHQRHFSRGSGEERLHDVQRQINELREAVGHLNEQLRELRKDQI